MFDLSAWFAGFVPGMGPALTFDSLRFLIFFLLVLGLSTLWAERPVWRQGLLGVASLYMLAHFCGFWLLVPVGLAIADWAIARRLHAASETQRSHWLALSLVLNLGTLAVFKYTWFVVGLSAAWLGHAAIVTPAYWVVPVGLSFTTFRSLSYVLDVHREWIDTPERSAWRYVTYVLFFPTLLAGPISRADEVLPRLTAPLSLSREQAGRAIYLFCKGLLKKVVIADLLAVNFVTRVFDSPGAFTGTENWLAAVAYGFQLYADFSGYTDMALAFALALGFELRGNFRRPFAAQSVGDFWRRWHLTLSMWFNDYVFTPLSFQWRAWGRWGAVLAVLVTFLLSGLWHGAALTFMMWGLMHGTAIAFETAVLPLRQHLRRNLASWYYGPMSVALTFMFLTTTFIIFRAPTLTSAGVMFDRVLSEGLRPDLIGQWLALYRLPAALMAVAVALHLVQTSFKEKLEKRFALLPWPLHVAALVLTALGVLQAQTSELQPFIYLQF